MEDRVAAITSFLSKRAAKEEKDYKPKKLQKKVVKKGMGEPHDFKLWLERLKRGAISGYCFDASSGLITRKNTGAHQAEEIGVQPSTSGAPAAVGMSQPKRKNKRKPDKPESTIEKGVAGLTGAYTAENMSKTKRDGKGAKDVPSKDQKDASVLQPPGVKLAGADRLAGVGGSAGRGREESVETLVEGEKSGAKTAKKRKVAVVREDPGEGTWRSSVKRSDIKTGAWASDEQEKLRMAIRKYALNHDLDPENFEWLLGKKHSQVDGRGMWTEIANDMPQRSIKAVAAAALRLFHPYAGKGAFTQDEDEALRGLVQAHGNKWTEFSTVLKRTPEACRLRWRDIKDMNTRQSGRWSEEEERTLVAAVEKYGNPSKLKGDGKDRRVLLDNIDWEAVVPHVPTRNRTQCVAKWYLRLAPSMADRGLWGQGDDKKLMKSLWNLLQNSTEGFPAWHEATVPWGELVEGRTGDECRRRWALLKKHVSNAKNKEFEGMVVELVRRYFPSWVSRPATATGHRASMSREP